jgi:urease accessory protein
MVGDGGILQKILEKIEELDEYHESALLSHVARRASKAQGIAMLTLFGRGLTRPVGFELPDIDVHVRGGRGDEDMVDENTDVEGLEREKKSKDLIDAYKLLVRKGRVSGHLSICWGIITAALGLSLGKSCTLSCHIISYHSLYLYLYLYLQTQQESFSLLLLSERSLHLYLFLHARSLLSTAVRMNIIGPYASSQMLLHPFKDIIDRETALLNDEGVTTGLSFLSSATPDVSARTKSSKQPEPGSILEVEPIDNHAGYRKKGFWDWTKEAELGPATTWPLGEVLMARHDMQHSRIFNS